MESSVNLHKNIGKELHCKPCHTKTNTFMERSCTVNRLTQKQILSWKGVGTVSRVTQKQSLSWKVVAL